MSAPARVRVEPPEHEGFVEHVFAGTGCDVSIAAVSQHPFYSRFTGNSLASHHMNRAFCVQLGVAESALWPAAEPRPDADVDGDLSVSDVTASPASPSSRQPSAGDLVKRFACHPLLRANANRGRTAGQASRPGDLGGAQLRLASWKSQTSTAFARLAVLAGVPSSTAEGTLAPSSATWRLRRAVDVNRPTGGRAATGFESAVHHQSVAAAKASLAQAVVERYMAQLLERGSFTDDSFAVLPPRPDAAVPGAITVCCGKPFTSSALAPSAADTDAFTSICMLLLAALCDVYSVRRGTDVEVVLRSFEGATGSLRPCVTCIDGDVGRFYFVPGLVTTDCVDTFALALADLNAQWHRDTSYAPAAHHGDPKLWQRLISPTPTKGCLSRAVAFSRCDIVVREGVLSLLVDHLLEHAVAAEADARRLAEEEAQRQYVVKSDEGTFITIVSGATWCPEKLFFSDRLDGCFRPSKADELDFEFARAALAEQNVLRVSVRKWRSAQAAKPPLVSSATAGKGPQATTSSSARLATPGEGAQRPRSGSTAARPAWTTGRQSAGATTSTTPSLPHTGHVTAAQFPGEIRAMYPLSFLEDDDGLSFFQRCELRAAGIAFKKLEAVAKRAVSHADAAASFPGDALTHSRQLSVTLSSGVSLPVSEMPFLTPHAALAFAIGVAKSIAKIHGRLASDGYRVKPVVTDFVPSAVSGLFPLETDGGPGDSVPSALKHAAFDTSPDQFITSYAPFQDRPNDHLLVVHHTSLALGRDLARVEVFGDSEATSPSAAMGNRCPVVIIVCTGASPAVIDAILDGCFGGFLVDRTVMLLVDESGEEAVTGSSVLAGPVTRLLAVSWKASLLAGIARVYDTLPASHNPPQRSALAAVAADRLATFAQAAADARATPLSQTHFKPGGVPDPLLALVADLRRSAGAFVPASPVLLVREVVAAFQAITDEESSLSAAGDAHDWSSGDADGRFSEFWENRVCPSFATHADAWHSWASEVNAAASAADRWLQKQNTVGVRRGSRLVQPGAQSPQGTASLPAPSSTLAGSIPQLAPGAGGDSAITPHPPSNRRGSVGGTVPAAGDTQTPSRQAPAANNSSFALSPTIGTQPLGSMTSRDAGPVDDVETLRMQRADWDRASGVLRALVRSLLER